MNNYCIVVILDDIIKYLILQGMVGLKAKMEKDTSVMYHLQLSHDIECIFSFKIITDSIHAFSICIVNA